MCDRISNAYFRPSKTGLQKHSDWLLIFDNVEDLTYVNELLPSVRNGYVLLTTLSHATGEIIGISLESMEPEEGALFLLRRAKILEFDALLDQASIANRDTAVGISRVLAGLPLALDQAGALYRRHKLWSLWVSRPLPARTRSTLRAAWQRAT